MTRGSELQTSMYVSGKAEWPIEAADWERAAEERLDPGPFGYIAGGAGSEATMRANLEAFERRRLRPRMLTGNRERDLSVEVLGTRSLAPFLLAPVGVLSIAHPEGEVAVARAAAATGVPMILSTASSTPLEQVAEELGETPRWFQLYWVADRDVVASLLDRAAAAGYSAVVLTVDTLTLGWRPRDLRLAYLPFLTGAGCAQFFTDPAFCARLERTPQNDPQAAALGVLAIFGNVGLNWDDLAWLREHTKLPVLIKGILTADDARIAFDRGVDGIVVSNHGGRQVDGCVAALDALVEVRDAVGDGPVVLMDGGIRGGADVLKAVALGADAVLLGRPYAYGLAVGGQAGVEAVIRQLLADVDISLTLVGGHSVRELDRSLVDG